MRETFCAMLVLVAVLFSGAAEFCSGRNTSFSCIETEREALFKFKLCFHDPSSMLSSWKGNDYCEWRGVGCDKNSRYVISLQLRGSISDQPQLSLIDDVKEVVSSLVKLRYLEHLDLSNNNFSANLIPPSFGLMKQLRHLSLSHAQFRGRIPSELGNLTRLYVLDLSQYYYEGLKVDDDIQWISRLSSLQRLDMSGVDLSHASLNLFQVLGMISSLSCNQFNGSILDSIKQLSKLESIDLSFNQLSGNIPDSIGQLSKLDSMDLSGNQLNGSIPDSIGQLSRLEGIDLWSNQLSGSIPDSIGQLSKLESINLFYNQLSGSIPNSIGQLSKLESIDLFGNQLSGSIPNSIGQLSKLENIDLSGNQLSGSIPNSIGQLSKLDTIDLSRNQLSESIPDSIEQLSKLRSIDLSGNQFRTRFPKWLQLQKTILTVDLSNASILGPLSENIDLADNNLTGRIPPCFGKFPIMVNATQLSNDQNWDAEPFMERFLQRDLGNWDQAPLKEVVKGRYLEYRQITQKLEIIIDLSSNNLIGSIPEELIFLKDLHSLNLSWNHLSGKIPEKIGQMDNLESLDFSKNGLSGTIPNSMSSLTKLSHLNLSYNNLSGPIPTGYQLQTLEDPTMYIGNPQLCGAPLLKKCSNDILPPTTTNFKDNDESELKRMWFYIVVMVGFAIGFWGVVGTLIFVKSLRYAYFQWVDDVQHWTLVVITLKVAQFKKMFNGNLR
ncbi:hypothetical protein SLEP1_g55743 [Rubroshorea leprosula]|uniref:Leucine-rich repeat-containing N-terminal plant-type domain-containing protein n=1 Tax=Rubroshorea leprosula TaxID=152421 RepID=A0AAV5MIW2_9ROSI|nr:hypothetical protein SLEP1_g55743 [Rubroshorea leprosula]